MRTGRRSDPFEIRPLATAEELRDAVRLEEEVWGEGFAERIGPMMLEVGRELGGVTSGAFDSRGRLVAFLYGVTGIRAGEPTHWSVMLAVKPDLQDEGLGTALKLHQRDELLSRGIRVAQWSFDPLRSRNAYLNFAKLGIVVREYVRDMYVHSDSPMHAGIGTDRFIGSWRLDSPRVGERVAGRRPPPTLADVEHLPRVGGHHGADGIPTPEHADARPDEPAVLVTIPAEIEEVMERSMEAARAWRATSRAAFEHYMGKGYVVRELVRDGAVSHYLLEREEGR